MRIACRTGRFVVLSLLFTILAGLVLPAFAAEDEGDFDALTDMIRKLTDN